MGGGVAGGPGQAQPGDFRLHGRRAALAPGRGGVVSVGEAGGRGHDVGWGQVPSPLKGADKGIHRHGWGFFRNPTHPEKRSGAGFR